ncbi:MAG: ribulose-phosphate 3-epimerase [Bifidobacteriaceae bacterium]|jgi:ribulose-phosphate 3-epimerase|nr:ribulose-phosphate 3-epimerase [Bifidobacteriaceae bacterium]
MKREVLIAPSILSADFANLGQAVESVSRADLLHFDAIDGHFAPNLTFGLPVAKRLAEISPIPLDVHLMIENPDRWAVDYAFDNVESVTFHYGAVQAPIRLAKRLRDLGVKACLAVRPHEGIEPILDIIQEFDMILVMTVEPGFSGQKFIDTQYRKIRALRNAANTINHHLKIQVDGGVSKDNIAALYNAGADVFVAGNAVFLADNPNDEVAKLREIAVKY